MNRLVELTINDLPDMGLNIMSFVENPAIRIDMQYFSDLTDEQVKVLEYFQSCGTPYSSDDVFIDEFSTISDIVKGISTLGILGKNRARQDEPGIEVFRYAGPSAERGFCRGMQRLDKVYTEDEVNGLNSINPDFGPGSSSTYSVWDYKGGVNCKHYWERLLMYRDGQQVTFLSQGPASGDAGKSCNSNEPSQAGAVARNASLKFNEDNTYYFSEDKKEIVGPAMIPDLRIPRVDKKTGEVYFVFFTKETIKEISKRAFKDNRINFTNENHKGLDISNYMIESWIVEDLVHDKSKLYGFEVPVGTWMTRYKIDNEELWEKIKKGQIKGLSVEGRFIHSD